VSSKAVPLAYDMDVVSSRAKRDDGAMTVNGGAYPAELFPKQTRPRRVKFQLGSAADGKITSLLHMAKPSNCQPEISPRPSAGGGGRRYNKPDSNWRDRAIFQRPDWTGYIGQWDNRLWNNPAQKQDFEPNQPPIGLVPGFIKRTPVAWFATHHNTPQRDAYYNYSYLFELTYDLPAGTKSLTLPDNSKIRVFAVSMASEPNATPSAAPLYDTLADHQPSGAPIIPQAGKKFDQAIAVTLIAPLYHRPGDLHYTLDGSDPTANSPAFDQPFMAEDTVKVAVAQIDENGNVGSIVRASSRYMTLPRHGGQCAGRKKSELTWSGFLQAA